MQVAARWPTLGASEVHLWSCELEAHGAAASDCLALLDAAELARWKRLRFEAGKHQLLYSHALLRTVIGGYLRIAPADLRFGRGDRGKPFLVGSHDLSFNLTHAGNQALLAVSAGDLELGVDIERHHQGRRLDSLARRHFAPAEVAGLAALPESARLAGFYDYWTLKEAYVKARGQGLALPLDGFWFLYGRTPGLAARPEVDPDPARWNFWSYREPAGYSAAVAIGGVVHEPPRHFSMESLCQWQERPWHARPFLPGA